MDLRPSIEDLLGKYRTVGIDTVAFIYHFEENKKYLPFTEVLFRMVETGRIKGITSTITLMEILVKPKMDGNREAVEEYKFILQTFPNLEVKSIDAEIAEKAAEIRAKYKLKPPDALQIATSLINKAEAFITNDMELKNVRELEIIKMREALGNQDVDVHKSSKP